MKNLYRFITVGIALMMVASLGLVITAQEEDIPGPGEGGAVIRGNERGSANLGSLIPIRCSGVDCSDVNGVMWPSLIALDPATQSYSPDLEGAGQLATNWEVSEDGTVYTVTMREDAFWTDGEPITAEDVFFGYRAAVNGDEIGLSSSYTLAPQNLVSAEIIDDFTISFELEAPDCDALRYISNVVVLPAHAFGYTVDGDDGYDWSQFIDHPFDTEPTVTAGPFNFFRTDPGTAVFLEDNTEWWDPTGEYVIPEGWVYIDIPDQNVLVERFLAQGENDPNFVFEPGPAVFQTLREAAANEGFQYYQSPGRVWHYLALNIADPTNPQNGLDEDGNPIDQGNHPLFGDVLVRQAIQHGINIDEIIAGAQNGDATPMVSSTIPTAFTIHPELERRAFDYDAARALLDEAGWVAEGDPLVDGGDGLRVCRGCAFAEEGTEFVFDLINPGSSGREDVAVIIQDQLAQIGIQANPAVLDFNTLYADNMGAQTYDAAVAGWRGGLPFDPNQNSFFGAENDIFGSETYGFNFTSYYNERLEEIWDTINRIEGCDEATRIALAHEAQEIMWEEQPYVWLYALDSVYAAAPNVQGFAPFPNLGQWNIDQWIVTE